MTYESSDNFTVGSIQVSPQHNTMVKGEHTCRLQPKAMAVLHYLAKNNDRVINNDELLDNVWEGRVVTHSSIQKCVNALRSAFAELDGNSEYIVYFSKQGYQLVIPKAESAHVNIVKQSGSLIRYFFYIAILLLIVAYFIYQMDYFEKELTSQTIDEDITEFTQVKPFASNTGQEQLIEPHASSERIAFIRDEYNGNVKESHLYIQGTNGQAWQVSAARGNFVALSWSQSGRNLVAIDVHNDNKKTLNTHNQQGLSNYYTFHIFTLDFKGEKVIEKNLLSHWKGDVSSVSWWDEGIIEFTAYQGNQGNRSRFRYSIVDQNLSMLTSVQHKGKLITSHIFNQQTATLSLLKTGQQIQFLNEKQALIGEWSVPFNVISMNWISDGRGVLLLSEQNQLSILNVDGSLHSVDYFPAVNGRIKYVRTRHKGKNIVLTVEAPSIINLQPSNDSQNEANSAQRFMEKGGGFIYSIPSKT